jgi:hypothetical protein
MALTNYKHRAEECRRLADLRAVTDHWAAFLEMAETGKNSPPFTNIVSSSNHRACCSGSPENKNDQAWAPAIFMAGGH